MGKCHVTTAAETGVNCPQPRKAKDCREPTETWKRQESILPESREKEKKEKEEDGGEDS